MTGTYRVRAVRNHLPPGPGEVKISRSKIFVLFAKTHLVLASTPEMSLGLRRPFGRARTRDYAGRIYAAAVRNAIPDAIKRLVR